MREGFYLTMNYEDKIRHAIKLLQSIPTDDGPIEISYSTGKDSDVILELAKMAGIPFVAVYKNTTIDRPGSIKHAREVGATIINPKKNMLQLIEKMGWPSRWERFCCKELKEYKVYDRAVQGIRRCESAARSKRYNEPEICIVYSKNDKARVYLPILEWTDDDVERFVTERNIKCHPHYYDEDGKFCVKRRVGCVGCPLQGDKGLADFKRYPYIFKAWLRAYKKWLDSHPDSKSANTFPDVYHAVYMKIFCNYMEEYYSVFGGGQLFDNEIPDAKAFLEQVFGIDLNL